MILLLISPFAEAGAGGPVQDKWPLPAYCAVPNAEKAELFRTADEYHCNGLKALNQGKYRLAIHWFQEVNRLHFVDVPNPGFHDLLAFAFHRIGEADYTAFHIDVAYAIVMGRAGYVSCDPEFELTLVDNRYTSGLSFDVLDQASTVLCGGMFANQHGKGTPADLRDEDIRSDGYERIRRAIGVGRALPPH